MPTLLRTPPLKAPLPPLLITTVTATTDSLNFKNRVISAKISRTCSLQLVTRFSPRLVNFAAFASQGEIVTEQQQQNEEPEIKDSADVAVEVEGGVEEALEILSNGAVDAEEATTSITTASLRSYRDALASNDEPKIADIESFLISVEDEKIELKKKVASLTEQLSVEKDRVFRISADLDCFRKRTLRESLSLVTKAQGEVVENLLPVLDNFERAKSQLKLETRGEKKISNCYQSIYKQFVEILGSISEATGKPFDPMGRSRVGSKPSQALDDMFRTFDRVYSSFMKEWVRF